MNASLVRLTGLAVVLTAAAACAASSPAASPASAAPTAAPIQTIEIRAADYSYSVPDTVASGWTKVTFKNTGVAPHHLQLFRARPGVTGPQLLEAIKGGPEAIFKVATAEGGASMTDSAASNETLVRLLPGTYLLACFLRALDQVPHHAKGMVKVVTVTDAAGGSLIAAPATEGTVQLKDFAIGSFPDTLTAGRHLFRVSNAGPQPHEANIVQLLPGKTARDMIDFAAGTAPPGQPPFAPAGGVEAVTAGIEDAILVVDLKPGTYLAICNVPDSASGKPHSSLGMIKEFTVK